MSAQSDTRIPIRIFNMLASVWKGKSPPKFDPEQLMETAVKRFGLSDFGDDAFLEGMRVLCDSLATESKLHPFGRVAAKNTLLLTLRNRLELEARWKEHPQVLDAPVERPLLIVGPPRTGTTLLFNLLALDDRFMYLRSWEATRPGLSHDNEKMVNALIKECKKNIDTLYYLSPELKKIHHLGPEEPEECISLLANSFESDFWSFSYMTKSYFEWYIEQDHSNCYSYYRKQLQWLQSLKSGRRWLLKSPVHLSAFDMLFKKFPDALVLQTHRDPEKVVPSISNLKYRFQSMFSYDVDKNYIGETALDFLSEAMHATFEAREENGYNIFDIRYEDLVGNPIGMLEQIYDHMGESFNGSLKERAKKYLSANPKNKYGKHHYTIEEIGLDKETIQEKFDFYYNRFNFATI